ncbi:hypothetical protein [Roseobacter sp. MH60115]|uniref:hypothetical protein n=1 Tax=Roseobacter sp. MH60115 TaxID=2785324 RepID=UPI0018A2C5B4|nr:hypothetical protein [Roseobacter sp. MH60115]
MNFFGGMFGGGGKPPSPLIASSGKWLATCIGIYAAIFWVPDVWMAWEDTIVRAILARYEGTAAAIIYWLLKIAAYPLMFFAVKMALGIGFLSFVMSIMLNLFGGKR